MPILSKSTTSSYRLTSYADTNSKYNWHPNFGNIVRNYGWYPDRTMVTSLNGMEAINYSAGSTGTVIIDTRYQTMSTLVNGSTAKTSNVVNSQSTLSAYTSVEQRSTNITTNASALTVSMKTSFTYVSRKVTTSVLSVIPTYGAGYGWDGSGNGGHNSTLSYTNNSSIQNSSYYFTPADVCKPFYRTSSYTEYEPGRKFTRTISAKYSYPGKYYGLTANEGGGYGTKTTTNYIQTATWITSSVSSSMEYYIFTSRAGTNNVISSVASTSRTTYQNWNDKTSTTTYTKSYG